MVKCVSGLEHALLFSRYPPSSRQHFIFPWTVTCSIKRVMRHSDSWIDRRVLGCLAKRRVGGKAVRREMVGRIRQEKLGRSDYATNSISQSEPHRL